MAALLHRTDAAAGVSLVFTVGGRSVIAGVVLLAIGMLRGRVAPLARAATPWATVAPA